MPDITAASASFGLALGDENAAFRRAGLRGKRVRVAEGDGFEGLTEGLDPRGFLRVKTANGPRIVVSGGVRPA